MTITSWSPETELALIAATQTYDTVADGLDLPVDAEYIADGRRYRRIAAAPGYEDMGDGAAPVSGALVGAVQQDLDGVLTGKTGYGVSVLKYIPKAEWPAIFAGTSTFDCSPAVQQAINENMAIWFPHGRFMFYSTVRQKTNGGARSVTGLNRLYSKIIASPALAASRAPLFWFGNSNGHGNYRLNFSTLSLDGGDIAGRGAAGAIGVRAHECGTSFVGDLYVRGCYTGVDAPGCIGSSFGGRRSEFYGCQRGVWLTDPTGGSPSGTLGGDSITNTESPLTLNANINHVENLWFSGVDKPILCRGGLTQIDHIILQSCGNGASDDLIHLSDANESYDFGAGPYVTNVWCEGGLYRSIIRVERTRSATIKKCFFSGGAANTEQAIIIKASGGTHIEDCSFRGSWSRALSEDRVVNATYYVHGDSRNGFFGPNYYTQASCAPYIEYASASHNNIVIDNHTAGNNDKGLTVGNIRISLVSGASTIGLNPDAAAQLGPINWYIQDPVALGSLRSSGYIRADTEYRIGAVKVVGARAVGWALDTGTAKRTANATYSGTAEAAYTQTTVQTLMNTVRDLSQTVKALKDDLQAHGLIGA